VQLLSDDGGITDKVAACYTKTCEVVRNY